MKIYWTLLIAMFCTLTINSQAWTIVNEGSVRSTGKRMIIPNKFILAKINSKEVRSELWKSPLESEGVQRSNNIISVMLGNGEVDKFRVTEYSMMEDGLAAKFPNFKTFYGQSISDPQRQIRIDYTSDGFRAVISDVDGRTYIDPYQKGDSDLRIIYKKKDLDPKQDWSCGLKTENVLTKEPAKRRFAGDCTLRTYRLAVAATGEYTAFHGGTVNAAMSAIMTTINRVNEMFEQDLAVRFLLIADNEDIVYTNANTDPYNNASASAAITQNQTNLDSEIGNANYDVGHVFTTGAGGLAGLGVICTTGSKARGVTGIGAPVGDPFDIDFVSHEIGHQFGGPHTFNGTVGNCSGPNRSNANAYEPGSGTTIMAYAGICGSDNIQNNSDAYFHAKSIELMKAEVQANSCHGTVASFNNTAPVVTALDDVTVPQGTYLLLEAEATDIDGDALTYGWEQIDAGNGNTALPNANNTSGPLFRSLFHTASPQRYLPSIDNIINNTSDQWEVLPGVSREMNFRVTVRDNALAAGCTSEQDININVDGGSGPFLLTNTSVPATVVEGQTIPLAWDVAGTNMAPVSCANVEILMSTDGGNTYPITILASTPNDGLENIVIPSGTTTSARIMVKCSDNIFFDINDSDFEVQVGVDGFLMALDPAIASACNTEDVQVTVNTTSINGYNSPITLSTSSLPAGVLANFSPNPVVPGQSSTMTLSGLGSTTGSYTINVAGVSGSFNRDVDLDLSLFEPSAVPSLSSPANNASNVSTSATIVWNTATNAASYDFEVSSSPGGVGVVSQGNTVSTSADISGLDALETYYWRVRSVNDCGMSNWSAERSFTTEACPIFMSSDVPLPTVDGSFVYSDLEVNISGQITDVDLVNIKGVHTYVSDLTVSVRSPNGSGNFINAFDLICTNDDDFDLNFDDEASTAVIACPPTDGLTYQPAQAFSTWDGEDPNGTWTLEVGDRSPGDIGEVQSWGLKICYDPLCDLTVDSDQQTGIGSLLDAIACASANDVITLESSLANQTIDLGAMAIIFDKNLSIEADPNDNISVSYTGSGVAITVNQGVEVTLSGFTLNHSSTTVDAINNEGILNIENVIVNGN